jgi:hypothetical protein
MIWDLTVRHHIHTGDRRYEDVIAVFRDAVGSVAWHLSNVVKHRAGVEQLAVKLSPRCCPAKAPNY